jgi:two-component sensor histidine kinase
MQYDFDRKEAAEQAIQSRRDGRSRLIGAVLALLVLIGAIAFYLQQRATRLKTALLEQKEETLRQRDVLMKEIHHRIKNNLQIIGTLLDLQLVNVHDDEARHALSESAGRLRAISMVHLQLYSNDVGTSISFAAYAEELHRQVNTIFRAPGQQVLFQHNIPKNLVLDVDTAMPLGLILNELVTNSYKYAFPNGANGLLRIDIEKRPTHYAMSYSDSGNGLPEGTDLKQAGTLGLRLLTNLSRQLHGAIAWEAKEKMFVLKFKDLAGRKETA